MVLYKYKDKKVKLAFFGIQVSPQLFHAKNSIFSDFFRFAGIDTLDFIGVDRIMRFRTIYVPSIGYDEDRKCFSLDYLLTFNQIIRNVTICGETEHYLKTKIQSSKIYLSRTKFAKDKEAGEPIIERFFAVNGYKVFYPEQMSFALQVLVYKEAEIIASVEGTIAHNILFSMNAKKQIIIRKQSLENWRQPWFNKMKNVPAVYINCYYEPFSRFPYNWDLGPFLMLFNDNLKHFASENNMRLPKGIIFANIESIFYYLYLILQFIYVHKLKHLPKTILYTIKNRIDRIFHI